MAKRVAAAKLQRMKIATIRAIHYSTDPMTRIKLAAIAKNEGAYLAEWIFHHLYIGVDEIEIWLNNCTDNSASILKQIAQNEPRVKFVESTPIFRACEAAKTSFQLVAYNTIFQTTKESKSHTHIIFLDLDEYLIGPTLQSKLKELPERLEQPAIISFVWFSDSPLERKGRFGRTIKRKIDLYRMNHVKSMAQLNNSGITRPSHHNFATHPGATIINLLSSGEILDESNTLHDRQILSEEFLEKDISWINNWFIMHAVYRSKLEYCASLLRGRSHNGDKRALKTNRWGYRLQSNQEGCSIRIEWPKKDFAIYKQNRRFFFAQTQIKSATKLSRINLIERYKLLRRLLKKKPAIAQEFAQALEGTKLAPYIDGKELSPSSNNTISDTSIKRMYSWGKFSVAMPDAEKQYLLKTYSETKGIILEYGTGGSTLLGLENNNVVIGAETDINWLRSLEEEVKARSLGASFLPCHMSIGKTKELGYPDQELESTDGGRLAKHFLNCSLQPWRLCLEKGLSPSVVLVDGRFRVACFLTSIAMADLGSVILFDDYKERSHYHVVEKIAKPDFFAGRMAIFKKSSDIKFMDILKNGLLEYYLSAN